LVQRPGGISVSHHARHTRRLTRDSQTRPDDGVLYF